MSLVREPTTTDESPASSAPQRAPAVRLGEELPVFCEKCGYSLHGLPQVRCGSCTVLQFHCPECGHHQPINTLRPAFQNLLGRIRAFVLVGSVVVRIAFFGLIAIAWFAMGTEWSYHYNEEAFTQSQNASGGYVEQGPRRLPAKIGSDHFLAFGIFGFLYGAVSRMLLLRWQRGFIVGLIIGTLMLGAILVGASLEWYTSFDNKFPYASPFTRGFVGIALYAAGMITLAASVVWPIWCGLVKVFLPQRAASALLAWQRSMSDRAEVGPATGHVVSDLARQAILAQPIAPAPLSK